MVVMEMVMLILAKSLQLPMTAWLDRNVISSALETTKFPVERDPHDIIADNNLEQSLIWSLLEPQPQLMKR